VRNIPHNNVSLTKYSSQIFYIILSVPHNIVMTLNNVMLIIATTT
jgi:hypothetical protein